MHHVEDKKLWPGSSPPSYFQISSSVLFLLNLKKKRLIIFSPFCIGSSNLVKKLSSTMCTRYRAKSGFSLLLLSFLRVLDPIRQRSLSRFKIFVPKDNLFNRRYLLYTIGITIISELSKIYRILSISFFKFKSHRSEIYIFVEMRNPYLLLQ